MPKIKCICRICKKTFYKFPSDIKEGKGKSCSRKCQFAYQKLHPNSGCYKKGHKVHPKAIEHIRNFYKGKKLPKKIIEKLRKRMTGKNNPMWKGGKFSKRGYIMIYKPKHPFSDKDGYISEHRLIIEKSIGRYLKRKEVVHHINHNPSDNRLKNLILFKDNVTHLKHHAKIRKLHKLLKINNLLTSPRTGAAEYSNPL